MTTKLGGNRDTASESTTGVIPLNATTAVTLFTAKQNALKFNASNPTNKDMVIRARPASADNDATGILLLRGNSRHISELDGYIGEVSAMMIAGAGSIWITRI